jgi:hypothetical protein
MAKEESFRMLAKGEGEEGGKQEKIGRLFYMYSCRPNLARDRKIGPQEQSSLSLSFFLSRSLRAGGGQDKRGKRKERKKGVSNPSQFGTE